MNEEQRDRKLGGEIAVGFFILGGPAALLIGYFADNWNRCILFGIVIILGEVSCFCVYYVTTFLQLFVCRVLTGISIGGASPIIFSLISDLYSASSRVYVATLIGVAMSAGVGIGQLGHIYVK